MQVQRLETALLTSLSLEALRLLQLGEFEAIASRFGYVFANGREIAKAIRDDLQFCLVNLGASSLSATPDDLLPTVQYFQRNNAADLLAAIGCRAVADNGKRIFVDLVVRPKGREMHLYLEDIHAPT
jgi:hypothetical protein